MNAENITLYYREGSSDKVYQASLESTGGGWVVNFAYGRRGSMLNTGAKTPKPVDYATAKKTYDKIVGEKTAKGYSPGEDGRPYQNTDKEQRATGILPQLLNPIEEAEVERLIQDDAWVMQEKFDGKRILIQAKGGAVIGINRKGLSVGLSQQVADAVAALRKDCVIDGESCGTVYYAFDLLEFDGRDLRDSPYSQRLKALGNLALEDRKNGIVIASSAIGSSDKREFLSRLRDRRAEGAVFKRKDAAYRHGRPASGGTQVKLKFVASATCRVASTNGTKRSVSLELHGGVDWVGVGKCTIPANFGIPKAGTICEIRYLYAYEGGSLYQPVYLGERDDADESACLLSQLKYKASEDSDE